MKKNIKIYLEESQVEYYFRIKSVVEFSKERLDKLNVLLSKYNLRDISDVKETIKHSNLIDFPSVKYGSIFMIDVVLGLPVSQFILMQEISEALKIPGDFIIVRADNEPIELENQRLNFEMEAAGKEGLKRNALLGVKGVYPEEEQLDDGSNFYGDHYNEGLKKYLANIAATRNKKEIDPSDSLFDWLKDGEEYPWKENFGDFNVAIEGAPQPIPYWDSTDEDEPSQNLIRRSPYGNFDDDSKEFKRSYTDIKSNKKVIVSKTSNKIRKIDKDN